MIKRLGLTSSLALVASMAWAAAGAQAHPAARAIEQAGHSLGQEKPETELNLTVWLNLHNRAELDARVQALYTPGSPNFHQWLSQADLAPYMPTSAEIATVERELAANHLKVTSVDPLRASVRFSGQTSDVEKAFHTTVNRYSVAGQLVRTSSSTPTLAGEASALVQHVSGLNSMPMRPHLRFTHGSRMAAGTAPSHVARPATAASGQLFSDQCFGAPTTVTYNGISAQDGVSPATITYQGLIYGPGTVGTYYGSFGCAYAPTDVAKIYGIDKVWAAGLHGEGQSIAIVDAFLQTTIQADVDAFNTRQGLPALDSSNFQVLNPYGAYIVAKDVQGNWNAEAALDVEWTHAMAPAAKINLVEAFSPDTGDLEGAVLYAITHKLGNVISNSYGEPESYQGPGGSELWNELAEVAASQGIALQFSTGDDGDLSYAIGYTDVEVPATSPYVTAVGGTSVALLADGTTLTTGWGTNSTDLAFSGYLLSNLGGQSSFDGGSGGGVSSIFAKPAYQSNLSGPGRHIPDVSALADPYTGADVIFTSYTGDQWEEAGGGTSLAAPLFSAMWTLANQAAGFSLGQAAPYIALLPAPVLQDVLPQTGPANLTGTYVGPEGTFHFSTTDLAQPLDPGVQQFTSALWNLDTGDYEALTFGTDTSLLITQGWDPVTGYGTPNLGAVVDLLQAARK